MEPGPNPIRGLSRPQLPKGQDSGVGHAILAIACYNFSFILKEDTSAVV